MDKLLQDGRYETADKRHGRMAETPHKGNLLETVEESKNEDKKTAKPWLARMGSMGTGKLS